MWSYVVVVDALPLYDRGIGFLDASHDFVAFSHRSVKAFNSIIVHFALDADAGKMNGVSELSAYGCWVGC